jgi:hypothetical protein
MNSLIRRVLLVVAAGVALPQFALAAGPVLLTMDDLPRQPVNGLTHPSGVVFGYRLNNVASNDAQYNMIGPGDTTFVQDPSIEGQALGGVLTITFPAPMGIIEFGVARSRFSPALPNGASVQLFDSANALLGTTSLTLSPMPNFIEAKFSHNGAKASRAVVSFPGGTDAPRFALDNLRFQIPEPTCAWLAALVGLGCFRRRAACFDD